MDKEPFKRVDSFEEADVLLIFNRDNLQKFNIIMKEEHIINMLNALPPNYKIVYFKSTNPHNKRLNIHRVYKKKM